MDAALEFINDEVDVTESKFYSNIGSKEQDKLLDATGQDMDKAYRLGLANYIDGKFKFENFACDVSKITAIAPLLKICEKIIKK